MTTQPSLFGPQMSPADAGLRAVAEALSRTVVATVAQQADYMKRVRVNGGSRSRLRPEGIVIFGHFDNHRVVAEQLRLQVPARGSGESVSVRLALRQPHHGGMPFVTLDGERWVAAIPGDPAAPTPLLGERSHAGETCPGGSGSFANANLPGQGGRSWV